MPKKSLPSVRVFYPRLDTLEVVSALKEKVDQLQQRLPLQRMVLFGSYARGNYTVASDIDLMVIYQGETRDDVYVVVRQTLGLPGLEPHVYSEAEYRQLQQTLDRMMAGGIIIYEAGLTSAP